MAKNRIPVFKLKLTLLDLNLTWTWLDLDLTWIVTIITRAAQIHPDNITVRSLRGRSFLMSGQYEAALEVEDSLVSISFFIISSGCFNSSDSAESTISPGSSDSAGWSNVRHGRL